ncbi:hypothetical protein CALVIDRAFT_564671 [Calocera viscosa TUFC12733]|uniref:Uncharacterized protein n=1 Tax=Calocera viscosa (strain TUFC12733) TaxID=1330018 RepID=A0A167LFA4_CALVF|nr:hypothetical protein CALVIDRAFT_564671 [Calocera viscosa TUFC12733]
MSDEYGASGTGLGGSLVNRSMDPKDAQEPLNNPPQGDTTSEGGFGGDAFSNANQRGSDKYSRGQFGQGSMGESSEEKAPSTAAGMNEQGENAGLSDSLNPYGESAEDPPAGSGMSDRRSEAFESGPGLAAEQDDGGQGQI